MQSLKTDERIDAEAGFSLFECIVALAIFAMVALSSITLVTQNIDSAARLEARSYAGFVAENLMVDTRLEQILNTSETAGNAEMGGFSFDWERVVTDTDEASLKRVVIRVRREGDSQTLAELSGFWYG